MKLAVNVLVLKRTSSDPASTAQGYGKVRHESGVAREEVWRRAGNTTDERKQSRAVVQPLVFHLSDSESRRVHHCRLLVRLGTVSDSNGEM